MGLNTDVSADKGHGGIWFLSVLSMCDFQERSGVMDTPRYLAASVGFNGVLWML